MGRVTERRRFDPDTEGEINGCGGRCLGVMSPLATTLPGMSRRPTIMSNTFVAALIGAVRWSNVA